MFSRIVSSVDWILFFAVSLIVGAGLLTMNSFVSENYFFEKQLISFAVFFAFSLIDWSFLRRSRMLIVLFFISVAVLLTLFITGSVFKGAQSWFNFGFFAFQPADPVKIVTILLLAKYFSKRHIEIANFKHIFVSGTYAFIFFILVLLQPDFGSAIIIFFVWFGMVMVSGISKKHLLLVFLAGALS